MDPYKVLEIKRGSTRKQIKNAYRKLSRLTHPDLNPDLPDMEFQLVNWAYRAITNPDKAGNCPYREPEVKTTIKQTPTGTSWRTREAKRKKVRRTPPPPNWGNIKDPTLKYYRSGPDGYYDEQRDYLFTEAPSPPPRRRKPRRTEYRRSEPRRATASVEDILDDDPKSEWQRKWAKKMKERCN
jgi:curved DNA-binding protein CbpA